MFVLLSNAKYSFCQLCYKQQEKFISNLLDNELYYNNFDCIISFTVNNAKICSLEQKSEETIEIKKIWDFNKLF